MRVRALYFLVCLTTFGVCSQEVQLPVSVQDESYLSASEIDQLLLETNKIRTSDFAKFTKNIDELSKNQINFTLSQSCSYRYLFAYKLGLTGNVQMSIDQFQDVKADCKSKSMLVRIESILANMYAISGDYHNALANLDSALSKIEESNDQELKLTAYSTAFLVYDLVNQNQLSLDLAQIVIDENPSKKQMCSASVYKYISLIKLNESDINESDITEVFNYCSEIGEMLIAQALNVNWIDYQLEKAETQIDTEQVHQRLLASNDSIMSTQYKNLIVFKDSLMGKILEKLERYEEAVVFAEKALLGSVTLGNSKQKIYALDVLINYHQSIGQYKKANDYLLNKNKAEISFYSDKQEKLMAYQTLKHDSMAKLHQINTLNQQNEVLLLGKELAEKSKDNQLLLIYLFASLIIFLLYIGYRIKKQQDMYKSLSEMDYMTKIYNRKGIKDFMEYLLPYSNKKSETIAFGVFDLDKFKKINDQYGHSVGDWVIKSTIKACKQLNNDKATFARLGGEEFAMILRDSNLSEIIEFSEQCRSAINAIETLSKTGQEFQISASFGITTSQISGYDLSILMNHADNALYESKENGRNKVTVFNPMSQQVFAQDSV